MSEILIVRFERDPFPFFFTDFLLRSSAKARHRSEMRCMASYHLGRSTRITFSSELKAGHEVHFYETNSIFLFGPLNDRQSLHGGGLRFCISFGSISVQAHRTAFTVASFNFSGPTNDAMLPSVWPWTRGMEEPDRKKMRAHFLTAFGAQLLLPPSARVVTLFDTGLSPENRRPKKGRPVSAGWCALLGDGAASPDPAAGAEVVATGHPWHRRAFPLTSLVAAVLSTIRRGHGCPFQGCLHSCWKWRQSHARNSQITGRRVVLLLFSYRIDAIRTQCTVRCEKSDEPNSGLAI